MFTGEGCGDSLHFASGAGILSFSEQLPSVKTRQTNKPAGHYDAGLRGRGCTLLESLTLLTHLAGMESETKRQACLQATGIHHPSLGLNTPISKMSQTRRFLRLLQGSCALSHPVCLAHRQTNHCTEKGTKQSADCSATGTQGRGWGHWAPRGQGTSQLWRGETRHSNAPGAPGRPTDTQPSVDTQ